MAIGVGFSGPRGGGGAAAPSDPSSFSDAKGLFLGDRGLTFVDKQLDDWENQGTAGTDAAAVSSSGRLNGQSGKGVGGYRDFQPLGEVNFRATGHTSTAISAFTFEAINQVRSAWNPPRHISSLGNTNSSNYAAICWIGSQGFRTTIRTASSNVDIYWSLANMGLVDGETFAYTLVYDGSQGTNADRMKLYINGVLKSQSTTPTIPATVTPDGSIQVTATHTNYSSYSLIGGYIGYWERILSGDEIAANQTWKEEIWNVAP
tara:strand:+ start:1924 stop:2706 length:783 start_codon:yes stop_codon:yes gene_type:complete